jgi:hypothetical protein
MTQFKAYPKIHRLGKEETDGILDDTFTIQEKIDGANVSIWMDTDTLEVKCGTRTRELPPDDSFNGFQEAVRANPAIEQWLGDHKGLRLYGEWLVKHTITYPDDAYRKIYLYDILDEAMNVFLSQEAVAEAAETMSLQYPIVFATDVQLEEHAIREFVGKSGIPTAANGEGVVLKNVEFKNKFGDPVYAKVVTEHFKESNAIVFGGNNKHSDSYWEMYIVNKYATLGRVQKIMMKLQTVTDHKLDMKETVQIAGTCYHDMVTEECWDIFKKVPIIDVKRLQRLAYKKFIQIYHDILNNSISIADEGK